MPINTLTNPLQQKYRDIRRLLGSNGIARICTTLSQFAFIRCHTKKSSPLKGTINSVATRGTISGLYDCDQPDL